MCRHFYAIMPTTNLSTPDFYRELIASTGYEWLKVIRKLIIEYARCTKPQTGLFEFIITQGESSVSVLPPESSLNFIAVFVYLIKPAELPGDDDRGFSIPTIRIDHRFQSVFSNQLVIRLRVKGRIKGESRTTQIHTNPLTKGDYIAEDFRQNRCIMLIDGFDRYWTYDEPVIIGDRHLFFAFLMFLSGVSDAVTPFFTTVFEPSP